MGFFKWLKKDVVKKAPQRGAWLARQPWFQGAVKLALAKYGVSI